MRSSLDGPFKLRRHDFLCALWLAMAAVCMAFFAPVAWAQPPAVVILVPNPGQLDAQALGVEWTDLQGDATIDLVAGKQAPVFKPMQADTVRRLKGQHALWLHFRVKQPATDVNHWVFELPLALLDEVTLYQRNTQGAWQAQTVGDTVAVNQWPEPGRHPFFRLSGSPDEVHDLYLRIRHPTPAVFPMRLLSEARHNQVQQTDYLLMGSACGALLLLIAATAAQAWVYRDTAYALYAAYAALMLLAVTAYGGIAAQLLWSSSGLVADKSQGFLAIAATGASLLFVQHLAALDQRALWLDRLFAVAGWAALPSLLFFLIAPKAVGVMCVAIYFFASLCLIPVVGFWQWQRRDAVGKWLLLAYAPLAVAVAMLLVRLFGLGNSNWFDQYGFIAAMALQAPLLLVALNIRSRERHTAETRVHALASQDALTGLLAPHLFHDRLSQIVARCERQKEGAAVVFIDLINYHQIKAQHGTPVAEQSVLRSVIKLRRILRDVDTISRIAEARFGLVLEGTRSRTAITERAARLIAAGLMPLPGLKPDVILQFHVVTALLQERLMQPPELYQSLDMLLARMSPRTRRPIRFLEPPDTVHMPMDSLQADAADSSLPKPMRASVPLQTPGQETAGSGIK
jgi:two-component system, sensor histidine kinase LadS